MATKLSGSMTAATTPTIVWTAYEDFMLRLVHTAGASTVVLQQDLLDDLNWQTVDTFTTSSRWAVEVPVGGIKHRLQISVLDTGPVGFVVYGKLNANDTVGGPTPASNMIEEAGDDILDEDGTTKLDEENA